MIRRGRRIPDSERYKWRRKAKRTPAASEPVEISISEPPQLSPYDQARVDKWIRDRLIDWPWASCLHCRKPIIVGQLWTVVDFQHVKPGKGGAFVRTKLKNVMSGKVVDRTFNAGVKVETASVDKREMQYLYREGEDFVFMDTQDYDQPRIPAATVGDAGKGQHPGWT